MALKGQATTITVYQISSNGDSSSQVFNLPQDGRVNMYKEIASGGRFYVESDRPISVTLLTKSKRPVRFKVYKNQSLSRKFPTIYLAYNLHSLCMYTASPTVMVYIV